MGFHSQEAMNKMKCDQLNSELHAVAVSVSRAYMPTVYRPYSVCTPCICVRSKVGNVGFKKREWISIYLEGMID